MNDYPLVSVLMAVYNCEETVEEAVKCIQNQTYTNWEMIIVDDCSTDNTLKVVKQLSIEDSRIKVFRNTVNKTLAPSLNICASQASGKFFARMDGDDVCDPTRFEKEMNVLLNHPEYAVVSCSLKFFDEYGEYGKVLYNEYPQKEDFAKTSPICHAGCIIRREVFEQLGGYDESPDVERIEDYDLWIRLYDAGYRAYNLQEYLYSMRDDRNARKRKKFKFRVTEYRLRKKACKLFGLPLKYKIHQFTPLILGVMPSFVYTYLHKKRQSSN